MPAASASRSQAGFAPSAKPPLPRAQKKGGGAEAPPPDPRRSETPLELQTGVREQSPAEHVVHGREGVRLLTITALLTRSSQRRRLVEDVRHAHAELVVLADVEQ